MSASQGHSAEEVALLHRSSKNTPKLRRYNKRNLEKREERRLKRAAYFAQHRKVVTAVQGRIPPWYQGANELPDTQVVSNERARFFADSDEPEENDEDAMELFDEAARVGEAKDYDEVYESDKGENTPMEYGTSSSLQALALRTLQRTAEQDPTAKGSDKHDCLHHGSSPPDPKDEADEPAVPCQARMASPQLMPGNDDDDDDVVEAPLFVPTQNESSAKVPPGLYLGPRRRDASSRTSSSGSDDRSPPNARTSSQIVAEGFGLIYRRKKQRKGLKQYESKGKAAQISNKRKRVARRLPVGELTLGPLHNRRHDFQEDDDAGTDGPIAAFRPPPKFQRQSETNSPQDNMNPNDFDRSLFKSSPGPNLILSQYSCSDGFEGSEAKPTGRLMRTPRIRKQQKRMRAMFAEFRELTLVADKEGMACGSSRRRQRESIKVEIEDPMSHKHPHIVVGQQNHCAFATNTIQAEEHTQSPEGLGQRSAMILPRSPARNIRKNTALKVQQELMMVSAKVPSQVDDQHEGSEEEEGILDRSSVNSEEDADAEDSQQGETSENDALAQLKPEEDSEDAGTEDNDDESIHMQEESAGADIAMADNVSLRVESRELIPQVGNVSDQTEGSEIASLNEDSNMTEQPLSTHDVHEQALQPEQHANNQMQIIHNEDVDECHYDTKDFSDQDSVLNISEDVSDAASSPGSRQVPPSQSQVQRRRTIAFSSLHLVGERPTLPSVPEEDTENIVTEPESEEPPCVELPTLRREIPDTQQEPACNLHVPHSSQDSFVPHRSYFERASRRTQPRRSTTMPGRVLTVSQRRLSQPFRVPSFSRPVS